MKHILVIFLLSFMPFAGFSGNNDKTKATVKTVSGKIAAVSGEQIAGAKIIVKETGESFFADLDGNFKLTLKTDKTYSIAIESIGFETLEVKSTDLHMFSDLNLKEL